MHPVFTTALFCMFWQEAKVDEWAQEYTKSRQEAGVGNLEENTDFWDNLQKQWEDIAK